MVGSYDEVIRQECGLGIIEIRRSGSLLSFAAPKFLRHEPLSPTDLDRIYRGLNLSPEDIVASHWIDNGPGWRGIVLKSDAKVRALVVDGGWAPLHMKLFPSDLLFSNIPLTLRSAALGAMDLGVIGPCTSWDPFAFEVRDIKCCGSLLALTVGLGSRLFPLRLGHNHRGPRHRF